MVYQSFLSGSNFPTSPFPPPPSPLPFVRLPSIDQNFLFHPTKEKFRCRGHGTERHVIEYRSSSARFFFFLEWKLNFSKTSIAIEKLIRIDRYIINGSNDVILYYIDEN